VGWFSEPTGRPAPPPSIGAAGDEESVAGGETPGGGARRWLAASTRRRRVHTARVDGERHGPDEGARHLLRLLRDRRSV